jgi:hypothetical protein
VRCKKILYFLAQPWRLGAVAVKAPLKPRRGSSSCYWAHCLNLDSSDFWIDGMTLISFRVYKVLRVAVSTGLFYHGDTEVSQGHSGELSLCIFFMRHPEWLENVRGHEGPASREPLGLLPLR